MTNISERRSVADDTRRDVQVDGTNDSEIHTLLAQSLSDHRGESLGVGGLGRLLEGAVDQCFHDGSGLLRGLDRYTCSRAGDAAAAGYPALKPTPPSPGGFILNSVTVAGCALMLWVQGRGW